MILNCIIDGNFLLNKLSFTLYKNNLLYGSLHKALENAMSSYRKWYPFANIYLVSDSKEKSWRKKLDTNYKAHRKRDVDMDWEFIYKAYGEFKESIKWRGIKVIESPSIEGDDFLAFLAKEFNSKSQSTIIVSNDHDIKQILRYNIDPLWINIMTNELYNKQKLFLPKNYQIFLNSVNKLNNNDIFELNDNSEFVRLINGFINKYETHEVDSVESLIVKVISGDTSDNIPSVWSVVKNGKKRGIGEKGAKSVFDSYVLEFGEPKINDPDLSDNIADLICEKKKLSKSSIVDIKNNIENNIKLINLDMDNIPNEIVEKMKNLYESIR